MSTFTELEKQVLLALSDLEPASLAQLAARTGIEPYGLKAILDGLARKGLLGEKDETEQEQPER